MSKMNIVTHQDGTADWEMNVEFAKGGDMTQQVVHGVVYEPDTVDAQNDFASADEIRKAAHSFLSESPTLGIMHKEAAGPRASIVESYIAPQDFMMGTQKIKKGTWMMAVKVHDPELWAKVQKGEITGFSMGGKAEADTQ